MIASVTAASLNIVLNYIFISRFGYIAAGYTTLFCYFVQAIMDYIAMKHVIGRDVYNMKYIASLSVGVVAVALISNLVYSVPIIRIATILFLCTSCIAYRKKIFGLIVYLRDSRKAK